MNNSVLIFITFTLLSLLIGCGDKNENTLDCTGLTPTYTADISVILNANCAIDDCHGNIGTQAGINLTTFENAKAGSSNGKFLNAIKHESGAQPMPQGSTKLSNENIKLIECWIKNGKPL